MQLTEIKKVLFYVIIFTIVLIGWVIVKNRTVQDQLPSSITPAPSPTSSVQASSATSDLKTYTNKEWGFEFRYPPNLTLKDKDLPVYTFTDTGEACKNLLQEELKSNRILHETSLIDPSTKFKVEVVTVDVYENADSLSLDDWLNSGTKFLEKHHEECQYDDKNYIEIILGNKKDVIIDNVTGIEGFSGCCMVSNKHIYLSKSGKIYNLTFSGDVNDSPTGKCMNNLDPFSDNKYSCPYISEYIYNQILASFKFTK
ncbi:MAG: PsbP-related protein [Patescibacteria group bacterium]